MPARAHAGKGGKGADNAATARYIIGGVLVVMLAAFLVQMYNLLFPNRPPMLSLSDGAAMKRVFHSGEPHFVLCYNGSRVDPGARSVFESLALRLRDEGVRSVSMDCTVGSLPSGASVAARFKLTASWSPAWFLVANGRAPEQLSPSLGGDKEALVKAIKARIRNSVTRVGHSGDVHACFSDRAAATFFHHGGRL